MTMANIRKWHAYLGLFIAPSVLFFALTGAVQLFGLHESHGDYRPPSLLEKLSTVHKDQKFALGDHHPPPGAEGGLPKREEGRDVRPGSGPGPGADGDHDEEGSPAMLLLKVFFLIVSAGLTLSTLIGVWMGVSQLRRPRLAWSFFTAGALIPLVLTLI